MATCCECQLWESARRVSNDRFTLAAYCPHALSGLCHADGPKCIWIGDEVVGTVQGAAQTARLERLEGEYYVNKFLDRLQATKLQTT